jgi:hypothetical protein
VKVLLGIDCNRTNFKTSNNLENAGPQAKIMFCALIKRRLKKVYQIKSQVTPRLFAILQLVINEHSVTKNRFFRKIGEFSTQINPVITNFVYNV